MFDGDAAAGEQKGFEPLLPAVDIVEKKVATASFAGAVIKQFVQLDVGAKTGAARGDRSSERLVQGNG